MLCWVEELCGEEEHDVSDLSRGVAICSGEERKVKK